MMEVLQRKPFNRRKLVSVGLFLTLAILVITGVFIQIFENIEEGLAIHFFIALHVLTGLIFTILSVLHTIINWKSLKSYISTKGSGISREALWAFLIAMVVIGIAFLFVYSHF